MKHYSDANFGDAADVLALLKLAEEKKAVIYRVVKNRIAIRPAAFIIQWPLAMIVRYKFHEFKKTPSDTTQ